MDTLISFASLTYLALWGGLIFLVMRSGLNCQVMGLGERRWLPPVKDKDPVCGEVIATERARSCLHNGNVYYFCSRDCREIFEAAPDLYVNRDDVQQNSLSNNLEHSHA